MCTSRVPHFAFLVWYRVDTVRGESAWTLLGTLFAHMSEEVAAPAPAPAAAQKQTELAVEVIKQFPGQQQVDRRVKVKVPGKFFPQLQSAEQAQFYEGEAVEFKHRHVFPRHLKAWGAARWSKERRRWRLSKMFRTCNADACLLDIGKCYRVSLI